ncbi:DUF305 domain-containing protein [Nonomuraea sp. NPDC050536]|uniref:DUF305 domain-containing protein n=1 Tax=Nonomuraea sp. NPDC050536 TaxID=3364366 RepID=UPI0037C4F571
MNRNAWFAALIVISGCTAQQPAHGVVPTGGPPVILPGEPGRPAGTATPGQTVAPPLEPDAADVLFAEAMVDHHRQALEMAALVPGHTGTEAVRAVASRVRASQEAEITWLTTWLAKLGRSPRHGPGHDLSALEAAHGAAFDRLFLQQMIEHHEVALRLAGTVLRQGRDPGIRRLATDIDRSQSAEIDRMRALLG